MKLVFHTPEGGDWLVIEDADSGQEIYSGHGHGDQIYDLLDYLKIESEHIEYPDEEYEEKFC